MVKYSGLCARHSIAHTRNHQRSRRRGRRRQTKRYWCGTRVKVFAVAYVFVYVSQSTKVSRASARNFRTAMRRRSRHQALYNIQHIQSSFVRYPIGCPMLCTFTSRQKSQRFFFFSCYNNVMIVIISELEE